MQKARPGGRAGLSEECISAVLSHTAWMKIKVISYSGYRENERPIALIINNERIEITEILNRWLEVNHLTNCNKRYFEAKGCDGFIYKICYDEDKNEWFLYS